MNDIFLPENVVEIEEGWCNKTNKLINFEIFFIYENKLLKKKKIYLHEETFKKLQFQAKLNELENHFLNIVIIFFLILLDFE